MARALDFTQSSSPTSASSETPSEVLKRTLSVHSVVSTSSGFAERMDKARAKADGKLEVRVIGLGSCGTVFELPGTELAYKKGSNLDAIWSDFLLTNHVHNATINTRDLLQDAFPSQTIPRAPRCHEFKTSSNKAFWEENKERFPAQYRREEALFLVDRILPLPQPTREALIKTYFDEDDSSQKQAMRVQENKHCLVRIYLGERETAEQQAKGYDSLRNFPMRLNMIEEIGLEKFELAAEMAIGLAIIHWQAQVDAMDTEFVLGSARTILEERRAYDKRTAPHDVHRLDFTRRSTHLWMLDFDKASEFALTEADVDNKLVPAFLGNDPYYPRPDVDEDLWAQFSSKYLEASKLILRSRKKTTSTLELPQRFLDKVVEIVKEHEDWDPEEHIVFGN